MNKMHNMEEILYHTNSRLLHIYKEAINSCPLVASQSVSVLLPLPLLLALALLRRRMRYPPGLPPLEGGTSSSLGLFFESTLLDT